MVKIGHRSNSVQMADDNASKGSEIELDERETMPFFK